MRSAERRGGSRHTRRTRRAKGEGGIGPTYVVYRGPIVVRGAAAVQKFGPVRLVENPSERLRPVPSAPFTTATYAPIAQSCPDSCLFKAPGPKGVRPCFADAGFTGKMIRTLEREAEGLSPEQIALFESEAIDATFKRGVPQDGARGGRDLRLHVSGDATTTEAAQILAAAAERWLARAGGTVWTYTHAWRTVPRAAWGPISVLASVESVEDAQRAIERGYAPAMVVAEFPNGGKAWRAGSLRLIPCPFETSRVTCGACRLCLDRDLHSMNAGIAFAMHGKGAKEGRRRLEVIADPVSA